eukprot:gene10666-11833_t
MNSGAKAFPDVQARIRDAVEAEGLSPEQVMRRLHEEAELQLLGDEAPDKDAIPSQIYIIAQALAYRPATSGDLEEIYALLSDAYREEVQGKEAFRQGAAVTKEEVANCLADSEYHWLVAESPNGHGYEKDGIILAVAAYTTNGISRRNGQVEEGQLCSVRYFAVLPRYRGLCIGQRFLSKLESAVFSSGCCRVLVCLPSSRQSLSAWIERRGYQQVKAMGYPFTGLQHTPLAGHEGCQLLQYVKVKPLQGQRAAEASTTSLEADSKDPHRSARYRWLVESSNEEEHQDDFGVD